MWRPYLRNENLYFTSLKIQHLNKLFRILLHGKAVCSLPFIYLINCLLISIWTYGYSCYSLVYNPTWFYFVTQIVPALVTGNAFSWHPCLLGISVPLWIFFITSLLLALKAAPVPKNNFLVQKSS